jgi:hypothetical protein
MASLFILGPSLDHVIEPGLSGIAVVQVAGKRGVAFQAPPTKPGGKVLLKLAPYLNPGDVLPLNIYAFFVQPVESVPALADRTPDWFLKSGAPGGSIHAGAADANGLISLTVSGVKPSLLPYFVQTVLEYPGA